MKQLIIMCGLPGSGKSTFIENEILERASVQVVCADDVRLSLGHKFTLSAEPMVHAICQTMVRAHMERGLDVVLDETNVMPVYVRPHIRNAREFGYHVALYRLMTPAALCKERRLAAEPRYPWGAIIDRMAGNLADHEDELSDLVDVVYRFDADFNPISPEV